MRGDRVIFGIARRVAVGVGVLSCLGLGWGQEAREPQLDIAVVGIGGAMSTLTVGYPSDPGLDQARRDAAELAVAGRWEVSPPDRAETEQGVFYESQITPALALDAQGQVPIFPFLSAFRRYSGVKLCFVGEAAGPQGAFHDANRFVEAQWNREGSTVTYDIRVKDSSFESAEDVGLTDRPASEPLPTALASRGQAPPAALWVLLVVGSAGMGVFAWGLTWWLLSRGDAAAEAAKEVEPTPEANDPPPPPEAAPPRVAAGADPEQTAVLASAGEAASTDRPT